MKKMDDGLLKKFNDIETIHWWWEGRRFLVKQQLKGMTPKKILDVGCGTGETLTFMKFLFPKAKLYGIDTSARAVKYAKARGHKNIQKANADDLPFKNNTFDLVLFLDVLEHIPNDQDVISEAARVLKKRGKILITSPGLRFIWSAHDTEQGHKRRYTRREIKKLAKNSNLRIKFISYFNFFLSPPIIIVRLLSNLRPFKSFANYDNGINYDIARVGIANAILKNIFIFEIKMLKFIKYPLGVSISALLQKINEK